MSVYTHSTLNNNLYLAERNIYGSSRIGQEQLQKKMVLNQIANNPNYHTNLVLGNKRYELSNHLGNVLNVVTDRKLANNGGSGSVVAYYTADVVSYSDYDPFGMLMPGRHEDESSYRYGFNGMLKDDEIKSESGTSYDFGARMYDPRIGRWLSIDPMARRQPDQSPYKAFLNNPMKFIDPDGRVEWNTLYIVNESTGVTTKINLPKVNSIKMDGKTEVWSGQSSSYWVNNYYDYENITILTISATGTTTSTTSTRVLRDNGIKDRDYTAFSSAKNGDTKRETYLTEPDKGVEVSFGIGMSGTGDGPIAQDWTKSPMGSIDFANYMTKI